MVNTVKIDTRLIDLPWTTSTNYRFDIEEGFTREVGGNKSLSKPQLSVLTATTFASGPYITNNTNPSYNATGVYDTSVTYNFDHGILRTNTSTNKLYLNQKIGSTGTVIASIATTSSRVTINTQSVTIDLLELIDEQRTYYLTSDSNIFEDMFKFTASAVSENNIKFTTGIGPQIISSNPIVNTSTRYPVVSLTYNRNSLTPQASSYKLYKSTGTLVTSILATDDKVSISSGTVFINFTGYLQPNSSYYVNAEYGTVKDSIYFSSVELSSTSTVKFPTGSYITLAPSLEYDSSHAVQSGNTLYSGQSITQSTNYIAFSNTYYIGEIPYWPDDSTVYIFNKVTGNFVRKIVSPLIGSGSNLYKFGQSISMNDTYTVIGCPGFDIYETGQSPAVLGRVYIYSTTTGELLRTINSTIAKFGERIDINDTHVIVNEMNTQFTNAPGKIVQVYNLSTGVLEYTFSASDGVGSLGQYFTCYNSACSNNYYVVPIVGKYINANGWNYEGYLLIYSSSGQYLRKINIGYVEITAISVCDTHVIITSGGSSTVYRLSDGVLMYTVSGGSNLDDYESVNISNTHFLSSNIYYQDEKGQSSGRIGVYSLSTGSLLYYIDNPRLYNQSVTSTSYDAFGSSVNILGSNITTGYRIAENSSGLPSRTPIQHIYKYILP